ncbi:MAG: hypothetical protein II453_11195 [Alphaproteobacteria bacterium]|nr:hypothetical protein [Alphaproteobacteria bacterium]
MDKSVINKAVFENNIIIQHNFVGKEMNAKEAKIFQEIVNKRRPYCSSDFKKQTFIPDLSSNI